MRVIELIPQKSGKVKVCLEDGTGLTLYRREVNFYHIEEGQELSEEDYRNICDEVLKKRARKRVLYLLQKQDYPQAKLEEKLYRDGYPEMIINDAISYAAGYGYIDDLKYASNYVYYHQKQKSRRQLMTHLLQKGISKEIIMQAIDDSYTADETELIERYLEKKRYDPETCDQKETQKMYQALLRRGFSNEQIRRCLKW